MVKGSNPFLSTCRCKVIIEVQRPVSTGRKSYQ